MRLPTIAIPAALLTAITLVSLPAFAGQRDHQGNRSASSGNQQAAPAQPRAQQATPAQPRAQRAAPAQPRVQQAVPPQPRVQQAAPPQPRAQQFAPRPGAAAAASQRNEAPRADVHRNFERNSQPNEGQRFQGQRNDASRGDARRGNDNVAPRAVPRPNVAVPHVAPRYEPRYQPHYDSHYAPRYEPRYYGSRSYVRPYVFRPRFSIGFGIFAGYPVPYSYYAYPYPVEVYGGSAPSEVIVGADSNAYGGITFEMTPYDADIYVDGTYAGHVSDFDGTRQPLTLTAGTHQIEVEAPGYQTLSFDVSVQPGQVIPYRGDLQR